MELFLALGAMVLVAVLAELFGADSSARDARCWWPGAPRPTNLG